MGESGEVKHIDIDHLEAEPTAAPDPYPPDLERESIPPEEHPMVRKIPDMDVSEFPSPAFIKRARMSYGALFEDGLDIFEEDGGVRGKGRKRSRFGRHSSSWRFASQSPSPVPSSPVEGAMDEDSTEEALPPMPKPQMADEGSQTVELELAPIDTLLSETAAFPPAPQHTSPPREEQNQLQAVLSETPVAVSEPSQRSQGFSSVAQEAPSTLFGVPKPVHNTFSMFGTPTAVRTESGLNLADQVRFGFSHIPQAVQEPAPGYSPPSHESNDRGRAVSHYPADFLTAPGPVKYGDTPYLGVPEEQPESEYSDHEATAAGPPAVAELGRGGWSFATQSPQYNQIEGGHFGADALNEGVGPLARGEVFRSDAMSPSKIPGGFSSYGTSAGPFGVDDDDNQQEPSPAPQRSRLVSDEATCSRDISDRDEAVDEESEGEEEYDENGEQLEKGDYDQRNYNVPQDDDEGVSEEEDEMIQETEERYGEDYLYEGDEDAYGERWEDEDGEEYDDESDEDEEPQQMAPQPLRKPLTAGPVVISLLSDSEDSEDSEDELPPPTAPGPEAPREGADSSTIVSRTPQPHKIDTEPRPQQDSRPKDPSLAHEGAHTLDQHQVQVVDFATSSGATEERPELHPAEEVEASSADEYSEMDDGGDAAEDRSEMPASDSELESDGEEESPKGPRSAPLLEDSIVSGDSNAGDDRDSSPGGDQEENTSGVHISIAEEPEDDIDGNAEEADDNFVQRDSSPVDGRNHASSSMEMEIDIPPLVVKVDTQGVEEAGEGDGQGMTEAPEPSAEPMNMDFTGEDDVAMVDATPSTAKPLLRAPSPSKKFGSTNINQASASSDGQNGEDAVLVTEMSPPPSKVYETRTITSSPQPHGQPPISSTGLGDTAAELSISEVPKTLDQQNGPPRLLPSSPPMTQSFDFYTADSNKEPSPSPISSRPVSKGDIGNRQLPTPMESQIPPEMVPEALLVEERVEMMELNVATATQTTSEAEISHSIAAIKTGHEPLPRTQVEQLDTSFAVSNEQIVITPVRSRSETEHGGEWEHEWSPTRPSPLATHMETPPDPRTVGSFLLDREPGVVNNTPRLEDDTTVLLSPSVSAGMGGADHDNQESQTPPHSTRRSARQRERVTSTKGSPVAAREIVEEEIMVQTRRTRARDAGLSQLSDSASPDLSIHLARQSVAAKRSRKVPEPLRTSPRVTRARSDSLQMSATPEVDEDPSISLARAALASPSKSVAYHDGSTASLKSELTRRLRAHRECISLKSLRNHIEEHPNVMAIVTTLPPPAVRAKGGPREYMMSFHVTDVSAAPTQVTEVQLYRPHKESLPVVKPGDAILLQRFQVKALSKKGFGLRSHGDSAWAVFDVDQGPPQIKGPPLEDWEQYSEYMRLLKTWYRSLDGVARGKLEKANKKLED